MPGATSCRRAGRRGCSPIAPPCRRRARCPGCCRAGCSRRRRRRRRRRGCCPGCRRGRRRRSACACGCGRAPAPFGELLADVGQHDRRQDRQQLLDQIAAAGAAAGQRRGHLRCCRCRRRCARRTCRPASASTWSTFTPPSSRPLAPCCGDGRLELAGVDVVGDWTLCWQAADERGHQRLDGAGSPRPGRHRACWRYPLPGSALKRSSRPAMMLSTFIAGCCCNPSRH